MLAPENIVRINGGCVTRQSGRIDVTLSADDQLVIFDVNYRVAR